MTTRRFTSLLATVSLLGLPALPASAGPGASACRSTNSKLHRACKLDAGGTLRVDQAKCLNLSEGGTRSCFSDAKANAKESRGFCKEVRRARDVLCREEGFAGPYDPTIDPDDFSSNIDNPYAPFQIGSVWTYEKDGEDGVERIVVEVIDETREILGVECRVVRDRAWVDGELIEDTVDWLAQDSAGNVWYFGEIAQNFEDGTLSDLDGSWESGVDGARPGIWIKAAPSAGEFYRQEWLPREAEDIVEIIDLDSPTVVPFANGNPVLETRDSTPLEPGAEESKFYVPGVGLVLETNLEDDERLELIEFTPAP